MKPFVHYNAHSVKEASARLGKNKGKAKPYSGGTDILCILKDNILPESPEEMINLKTIDGLDQIKEEKDGLLIGALTKLSDIVNSPVIRKNYKLLAGAAKAVATPNIRNMATIGGNLAQDVRCWYYRYSEKIGGPIICLRKGGKQCNALSGDNRYHSVFGAARPDEYPCSVNCPAHADIPFYLDKLKKNDPSGAANILLSFNPFPAITGRICPVFCESHCNRKEFDEPVAIQCVEKGLGDYILEKAGEFYKPPVNKTGKKIAVVGSGPAGLSAAYYLRMYGHEVTIFEKLPLPGGMLSYGIPPYRLSKEVVKKYIDALKKTGIDFKVKNNIGKDISITNLATRFDAVFLSTGAWKEKPAGISGEEHIGSGLGFLNRVNTGDRRLPGKKVAVIGAGNTAMDVARTLLRMGADPLVIYRRSRNEMPAVASEIKKAEEEGVRFEFLTLPKAAVSKDGIIILDCIRMELGAPDPSGRPKAVPVKGSDFTLNFDAVIKAIGEEHDLSFLTPAIKKKMSGKLSSPSMIGRNLFAGGDFVTGPSTAVEAIASGRNGAAMIEEYLRNTSKKPNKTAAFSCNGRDIDIAPAFSTPAFEERPRVKIQELSASERVKKIDAEEESALSLDQIKAEGQRCFNCGCLAVGPSDIGTALTALNAGIITNKRKINAAEFFSATATASNILGAEEIITGIKIPCPADGAIQNYIKFTLRKPVDFALVSVASMIKVRNGVCEDVRIVLGAVAPSPLRAFRAEEYLKGKSIDEYSAQKAGELALEGSFALNANEYKIQIARSLVKKAVLKISD